MKALKKIIISTSLLIFLFSATSCVFFVPAQRHDNGKHKGWYKKKSNSNTPYTTRVKVEVKKEPNHKKSKSGKRH